MDKLAFARRYPHLANSPYLWGLLHTSPSLLHTRNVILDRLAHPMRAQASDTEAMRAIQQKQRSIYEEFIQRTNGISVE